MLGEVSRRGEQIRHRPRTRAYKIESIHISIDITSKRPNSVGKEETPENPHSRLLRRNLHNMDNNSHSLAQARTVLCVHRWMVLQDIGR